MAEAKLYSIIEIARKCGFTIPYVRTLIRKGTLQSEMRPLRPGSVVMKHFVPEESLTDFLSSTTRKSRRADGRSKYVFYASPKEYDRVLQALLKEGMVDIVESLRSANKVKPPYKQVMKEADDSEV